MFDNGIEKRTHRLPEDKLPSDERPFDDAPFDDVPFDEWEPRARLPRGVIPEDLGDTPPDAELAARLESVDRSRLNGFELVEVLRARWRLISHLYAELYADMEELAHTTPGHVGSDPERSARPDEFCVDEVAAALVLTPRSADFHMALAFQLADLPVVAEALRTGEIDVARARILCQNTSHLEPAEAISVVTSLIDEAAHLTTGQLARRLRRRILDQDPDTAKDRYESALEKRHLDAYPNPDGTGDLLARHLPPDRIAAIMSRLDEQARRISKDDDRTLDQIRADLFLDLLEGRTRVDNGRGGHVELRIDLETLMGLNDRAATIPGWGPVIADIARGIADAPHSQWRVVATENGDPVATTVTRRRPGAALRRLVEAQSRTCVFPGCSKPATRSHLDHVLAHALGGLTIDRNLAPGCAHHHLRSKHRAGWRLQRPSPGVYHWTSPRGHEYVVRPPPD